MLLTPNITHLTPRKLHLSPRLLRLSFYNTNFQTDIRATRPTICTFRLTHTFFQIGYCTRQSGIRSSLLAICAFHTLYCASQTCFQKKRPAMALLRVIIAPLKPRLNQQNPGKTFFSLQFPANVLVSSLRGVKMRFHGFPFFRIPKYVILKRTQLQNKGTTRLCTDVSP